MSKRYHCRWWVSLTRWHTSISSKCTLTYARASIREYERARFTVASQWTCPVPFYLNYFLAYSCSRDITFLKIRTVWEFTGNRLCRIHFAQVKTASKKGSRRKLPELINGVYPLTYFQGLAMRFALARHSSRLSLRVPAIYSVRDQIKIW